jgi:hypothetical protein
MIMWLFLLIPLTTSSVYAEIITLSTQSSISCVVTKRDAEPAVYINPPIKSEFTQRQPEIDNWITKDWTPTSSLFSNHYPITDKRWEGFKLYDETYGGNLYNSSFSFSMCMYEYDTVTFTVMSEDFFNDTRLNFTSNTRSPSKNEKSCRWSHYTFERKENTVHLYSEEGMIVKTFHLDYIPYWLYFKRISNKVLWRLHNYTFRSANTISLNQEPDLDISFGDNLCLSMYVSVDSDCFLDINLKSEQGSSQNVTVNGLNVEGSFKTWHKVEIHAKNSGKAHLSFYRRHKVQGTTEGYWAVDDIRFCTGDTEVYQVELKDEKPDNYVCEVLTSSKQLVRDENVVLCDKAGFLGSECNLSCSTILGASYPNCENHRICQGGSNCFCSWGYQEPFCNQTCVSGTWGLFCKNKCPTECPSCHPSTGECLDGIKKMDIKIALNLREIPMPQNIKLVSNRIHVTLPDFEETEENITYDLQYFCDSGWCKDELVYNHTITVNSVDDDGENTYKFENLTPFTDYKAIVIARKSESARIYYSIKPDQLNPPGMNMSVYCNNETTLWVKFQLPLKTSESDYRLWYKKSDPDSRPMKLETLSRCEFWDGFVCGRIDNLTQGIDYSLIVERLEMDNQKWGLSEEISAKTAPQAPPAPPQNILVSYSSNNETILSWEQPSIQYCPLTKFEVILMKKNEIMDYAVVAKKNQITYSQKISLEYQTPCSVDIYAVNHCKGEPSKINITLIPSNTMLSSKPTIQICSQESCRFMVPKPKLFNTESQFHLLITDKANEDTAIKTFKLKEKKGKIEVDSPSTISKLEEIDDIYLTTENKILSLGNNRSDALYLIEKSFDGIYHDYPVKDVKKDILTNSSWEIFLIVGLSIFATLFLLLLALHKLCSYYRVDEKRSQYHANTKAKHGQLEFDNKTEHVILIPAENLLLETSIDRNDFEHNTKNVWKGLEGQFRSLPAKVIKTISVALKNKNVNKNKDLQNLPCNNFQQK